MDELETEHLLPAQETRRCSKCGDLNMAAATRSIEGFEAANHYICPNCGHEVKLTSPGNSGFYLALGLVATAAIVAVMAASKGLDTTEIVIAGLLLAFFTTPSFLEILARWRHPVTGVGESSLEPSEAISPKDPLRRGIASLDAFSFLKSFLGVFIFLALWLVFWAGVGLIHDNFF